MRAAVVETPVETREDRLSQDKKTGTEYAIKQVGERYYPVIVDHDAGGHYEISNPLTGGILSYKDPEAAETYIRRANEQGEQGGEG